MCLPTGLTGSALKSLLIFLESPGRPSISSLRRLNVPSYIKELYGRKHKKLLQTADATYQHTKTCDYFSDNETTEFWKDLFYSITASDVSDTEHRIAKKYVTFSREWNRKQDSRKTAKDDIVEISFIESIVPQKTALEISGIGNLIDSGIEGYQSAADSVPAPPDTVNGSFLFLTGDGSGDSVSQSTDIRLTQAYRSYSLYIAVPDPAGFALQRKFYPPVDSTAAYGIYQLDERTYRGNITILIARQATENTLMHSTAEYHIFDKAGDRYLTSRQLITDSFYALPDS